MQKQYGEHNTNQSTTPDIITHPKAHFDPVLGQQTECVWVNETEALEVSVTKKERENATLIQSMNKG